MIFFCLSILSFSSFLPLCFLPFYFFWHFILFSSHVLFAILPSHGLSVRVCMEVVTSCASVCLHIFCECKLCLCVCRACRSISESPQYCRTLTHRHTLPCISDDGEWRQFAARLFSWHKLLPGIKATKLRTATNASQYIAGNISFSD